PDVSMGPAKQGGREGEEDTLAVRTVLEVDKRPGGRVAPDKLVQRQLVGERQVDRVLAHERHKICDEQTPREGIEDPQARPAGRPGRGWGCGGAVQGWGGTRVWRFTRLTV